MNGKKYWVMGATAALVTLSSPAVAATLSNAEGQSCGDRTGVWHFVNNQTGGATSGNLTATFSDGTVWTVAPSKVLPRVMHYYVESTGNGTLVSASTGNVPGRLVLSDYTCGGVVKK